MPYCSLTIEFHRFAEVVIIVEDGSLIVESKPAVSAHKIRDLKENDFLNYN